MNSQEIERNMYITPVGHFLVEMRHLVLKAGSHVRRKHKHKHKKKYVTVNRGDASTSASIRKRSVSFFLRLRLRRRFSCAYACAYVLRVNQCFEEF